MKISKLILLVVIMSLITPGLNNSVKIRFVEQNNKTDDFKRSFCNAFGTQVSTNTQKKIEFGAFECKMSENELHISLKENCESEKV
jgi:hypothetical protein